MGHLSLLVMKNRLKTKLKRTCIKNIWIKRVRHIYELLTHKKQKIFVLKLYNVEFGAGINLQKEITETLYNHLLVEPLIYHFSFEDGQMLPLSDYLKRVNFKVISLMKVFSARLRRKKLMRQNKVTYKKREISIIINNEQLNLYYTIFV